MPMSRRTFDGVWVTGLPNDSTVEVQDEGGRVLAPATRARGGRVHIDLPYIANTQPLLLIVKDAAGNVLAIYEDPGE